jgi:hypothetical protein
MRIAPRRTLWAIALILGSVFTLTDAPEATASKLRAEVEEAVRDMGIVAGKQVQVTRSPVTGLAIFIAAEEGFPIPTGIDPSASTLEHALIFLQRFGAAFGLKREDVQLVEVSGPDEVGLRYVRLQQIHDGLPVIPGELTAHLQGAAVTAVLARTLPDLENFPTVPTVSAAEALDEAKNVRPYGKREKLTDASLSVPQLVIYNRALLEERAGRRPTLAWLIEARKPDVREFILVDALQRKVLVERRQRTVTVISPIHMPAIRTTTFSPDMAGTVTMTPEPRSFPPSSTVPVLTSAHTRTRTGTGNRWYTDKGFRWRTTWTPTS